MKNRYFLIDRVLLVCGVIFSIQFSANAQSFLWAKQGSSQGFEYGNAIVADDSGNVYVSGQIEYSAVFENVTLNSNGKHDILVGKFDTDGNLKWVKHAGGNGGDVSWGVGVDAQHRAKTGLLLSLRRFSGSGLARQNSYSSRGDTKKPVCQIV